MRKDTWATARNTYFVEDDAPTVINREAVEQAREVQRLDQLEWWKQTAELLRARLRDAKPHRQDYYAGHLAKAEARIKKLGGEV